MLQPRQLDTALVLRGLTPSLRQLKDCRHTLPSSGSYGASQRARGCLTCNLAAKVMKSIEIEQRAAAELERQNQAAKELEWARAKRDVLLMRHPTNWADFSLMQGPRPPRPKKREPGPTTASSEVDHGVTNLRTRADREGAAVRGSPPRHKGEEHSGDSSGEDSRPKLVPGALLTLSRPSVEAIMAFTEEVLGEEDPQRRARKAEAVILEAVSEVAFAKRRDGPRTGVFVAAVRGWLARRLARALLLRGGCRRELDITSGAWQYVWGHQGAPDAPALAPEGALFRSWYPPTLLKNEILPSPRSALRRVEGEEKKREARLALANNLLDEQRVRLSKRDARATRLLALAEVVKLVERAAASLESAALGCSGIDSKPPCISVKVLHPRGGEAGDGAREAVVSDIMAQWHQIDTKARERAEASRIRAERAAITNRRSPRQNSPGRGGGGAAGKRSPRPASQERRGNRGAKREPPISVPTTNHNLAEFYKRLLQDSLHEDAAAAVASLLQRRRVLVAIHEASRLGRNEDAWEKKGTSPLCLGIQVFPPWARASHRFIALAHRGRLVAVSQASPFVYWETLANKSSMPQLLRGILGPFLENTDLLRAMFAGASPSQDDGNAGADASAARRPTTTTPGGAGGAQGETRKGGGEKSPPPPTADPATAAAVERKSEGREDEPSGVGESSWGYQFSLSSKGCWKVDARAAARRDGSVRLSFDSVAFDVFVRPRDDGGTEEQKPSAEEEEEEEEEEAGKRPAAVVTNAVPFRLADGLPRELGPILFEESADAPLLSGDPGSSKRGARRARARRAGAEEREGPASSKPEEPPKEEKEQGGDEEEEGEEGEEEEPREALWVKKKDPRGLGRLFSHVYHGGDPTGEGAVEIRIRGEPLDVRALAVAGLPQDMSALVVATADDVDVSGTNNSKRAGDVVAGVSGKGH